MKQFHRNQADVSAKTGKKGRKLKKNHSVEACKCLTPFVKLHWWDCPEVNKPCPIHGNVLYQNVKPDKVEPDQNITISFHPSTRTEKLFEPFKSLLAQCDPEAKINFQYFSPSNFTDKENLKHEIIQTSFEDLRKDASNNSVEKTKSSINEKTNKMKKLKECFHSPCNSIAQKYPSPPPIRRNCNEISHDEGTQYSQNFFSADVSGGQSSEWFSSNPFGFKKLEKLTADKRDSDFITVTQQDKDNVINHKVFEIDHRKGMNENQLSGLGKQTTQLAYSSFSENHPNGVFDSRKSGKFNTNPENTKPQVKIKDLNYNNSQLSVSSSGSVYLTPFLLMPRGLELSDNESFEETFENGKRSVGVQVKEGECECEEKQRVITRYVQISAFESSDSASEHRMNTVSLQTDPPIRNNYMRPQVSSEETLSENFCYNEKVVQTNIRDNTRIDKAIAKTGSKVKTTEVQTSNRYQIKEVLITRYNKAKKEAGNQIDSGVELQEGGSSTLNKSLMTQPSFANKTTQISNSSSNKDMEISRFRQLEDEDIERLDNVQKYESDSDFFDGRKDEKQRYAINQKNSSRSPERFQANSRTPNSPVSDLSELKRIIDEFFERATCNCREKEYEMSKKSQVTTETMTEEGNNIEKTPTKENLVSKEMRIIEPYSKDKAVEAGPTQLDEGTKQYRQTVLLDDTNQIKTNYICSFCGRDINKFSLNVSTNTDDMYAVKEKTTIIETDYTEITKVKKSTDPKDPSKKFITTSTKQTIRPIANACCKNDSPKIIKTVHAQISSTRSNIPLPVPSASSQMKNEKQNRPPAYRDSQDSQCTTNACRAKAIIQKERRVASPAFRECQCNELPEMFLSVQDNKCSPRSGLSCSLPRSSRPDDDSGQSKYRENKKENQKQSNRHFYHVTVNPPWPKDLVNSWKSQDLTDDSLKRNTNRKTDFDKSGQRNEAFSIKNFDEIEVSRQGSYEPEKHNYPGLEKCRKLEPSKENFGFARMPSSSASQISMSKGSHYQSKIIKSEESVKTLNQQSGYVPINIFREDGNELFTVKSCHLNPIKIVYDGQPCDKLLACSACKSLVLLKVNKNDDVSYVPDSSDQIQNQNTQSEPEEKISTDEAHNRQIIDKCSIMHENVEEQEEEYTEKYSNFSDTTSRTIEHDYLKEGNTDSDN